jgi:hypothetical protein
MVMVHLSSIFSHSYALLSKLDFAKIVPGSLSYPSIKEEKIQAHVQRKYMNCNSQGCTIMIFGYIQVVTASAERRQ